MIPNKAGTFTTSTLFEIYFVMHLLKIFVKQQQRHITSNSSLSYLSGCAVYFQLFKIYTEVNKENVYLQMFIIKGYISICQWRKSKLAGVYK